MTLFHRIHLATISSSSEKNKSSLSTTTGQECRLLATSASSPSSSSSPQYQSTRNQLHILALKETDGPLCQYRKGFFEHLKPKPFVVSTLRVVTQQGTLIMANFMTDQLESDMKRNELVQEGKISQAEADEQAAEWEKREWEKRWQVFPSRLLTAFAKYHVITLVMRCYESIAATMYDKVTMDKLTMDPFQAAKKFVEKENKNHSYERNKVAKSMFHTTFWANLIAFMADYSVHQVILCYVYYRYIRQRRQRRKEGGGEDKEGTEGALFTSFLRKSTQLCLSRSFGLVCSAAGGAVGTLIFPGWGTLLVSNMGEGVAGVVLDDGQGKTDE